MKTTLQQVKTVKSESFLNHLLLKDSDVRALLKQKLLNKRDQLRLELAAAEAEQEQFNESDEGTAETPSPAQKPVKKAPKAEKKAPKTERKPSGKKPGRPKGKSPNHTAAILEVVKETPKMTLNEIFDALMNKKHEVSKNIVSTYVSNMVKRSKLTAVGTRPQTRYSLSK